MRRGQHDLANVSWNVADLTNPKQARSPEHAILAVLMDIRKQLYGIGDRLDCGECLAIPRTLRQIAANTKRRKPNAKAKPK
jgi:hypothetical protein